MDDQGRKLALEKLCMLRERLERECREIESRLRDDRLKSDTRRAFRDKLAELKGAVIEIENLQQRLARI
jgi:hypothetical protein